MISAVDLKYCIANVRLKVNLIISIVRAVSSECDIIHLYRLHVLCIMVLKIFRKEWNYVLKWKETILKTYCEPTYMKYFLKGLLEHSVSFDMDLISSLIFIFNSFRSLIGL